MVPTEKPVRLAMPGSATRRRATADELEKLQVDLDKMCPGFAFELIPANTDVDAVDMVTSGKADIAESDAAGVIGKYVLRGLGHVHCTSGLEFSSVLVPRIVRSWTRGVTQCPHHPVRFLVPVFPLFPRA